MKVIFLILLVSLLFVAGCDSTTGTNGNSEPTVNKGATPVADNEIAVIEMEEGASYGTIKIELYSNIAPKMVARFKELAKEGFYNGVSFHRINGDVIQSGDPNSKDNDPGNDGQGGSKKPNVPAEFSDLNFEPGILGAARGEEFDSANSQFFIMKSRQPDFDGRYTIFGKVIDGMNNVVTIGGAPAPGEKPVDKIIIKSITIQPKG